MSSRCMIPVNISASCSLVFDTSLMRSRQSSLVICRLTNAYFKAFKKHIGNGSRWQDLPTLSAPLCRRRSNYWIKTLVTAFPNV